MDAPLHFRYALGCALCALPLLLILAAIKLLAFFGGP